MSEHLDESVNREIDDYIAKCRAMHKSQVAPVPRFAHAVSALADERDALLNRIESLEQAIWEACDLSFVAYPVLANYLTAKYPAIGSAWAKPE